MPNKNYNSILKLIAVFVSIFFIVSCGSDSSRDVVVRSSDGKVLLILSSSDADKASDISISPITEGVTPGAKIYSFEPDGLVFNSPARLEINVSDDVSRDSIQPLFLFSASNDNIETLNKQRLDITSSGATLSAEIEHFSLVAYSNDSNISVVMSPVPTSIPVGEGISSNYRVTLNSDASAQVATISYLPINTSPISPTAPEGFSTFNEFTVDGRGGAIEGTETGGNLIGQPVFQEISQFTGTITASCAAPGTGLFRTAFGFLNFEHQLNLGLAFQSITNLGLLTLADNTVDNIDPNLLYEIRVSEEITCTTNDFSTPEPTPTPETIGEPGGGTDEPITEEPTDTSVPGIAINNTTFVFDHSVGITECPQSIGSFEVENTGNEPLEITISGANNDTRLVNLSTGSFTLQPGEKKTVNIAFNCGQPDSFNAQFLIEGTGTSSGNKVSSGLEVRGNVG